MLESRQIRAARALLNWSEEDLASATGIHLSSIKDVESNLSIPCQTTLLSIQDTFEKAGIEFLLGNGVRPRKQPVMMLHGVGAYWALLDDITKTLAESGGEVCVLGMDEARVAQALDHDPLEGGEKLSRYVMSLQKNRLRSRSIIKTGDTNIMAPISWYRSVSEDYFAPQPLYIYANKVGILHLGPPFKAIIYDNPEIAAALRKTFNFIWDHAEPLQILRQTA
jgi:transcriptional regulator with XRE-family HTH domain